MSWIREIQGLRLSNVIKVMSINPRAMQAVQDMNAAITFGASVLTRKQEEAIATTVAVLNRCRF
jgi:alkylhydroperoxidase family enzyme